MSRIGRMPVPVPSNVEVQVAGSEVQIKGPKGVLNRTIHPRLRVYLADGKLHVERPSDEKTDRALHGTTRALIANMVHGVTEGYEKALVINGVGYRAAKQGNRLVLTIGFSHPVEIDPPEGITFDVPAPNRVVVRGIDKELVGQMAATIRGVRPAEPYLGKGIQYEGEQIRRKAGKAGKVTKK
ncbi:MAG: 50S ribosomal protein L6 [Limnochordaceae bacterium]|nr:50S ribosomal protein L6 [Limnochordaceae bacterium]